MRRVISDIIREETEAFVGEVVSTYQVGLLSHLVSIVILEDGRSDGGEDDPGLEELEPSCADDVDGEQMIVPYHTALPVECSSKNVSGLYRYT